MSGGGGSSTSTSSTQVPQYIQDQHQSNLQLANAVTGRDYQPYTGQRVADFSQAQKDSLNNIGNIVNTGTPWYAPALQTTSAVSGYVPGNVTAGQLANTDMSAYMNPYTSQVIDATVGDMTRANQQAMASLGSQAAMGGAYGGSRMGIAQAEQARNYLDKVGQTSAGLRAQGYSQAQAAAQQDIANRLAADQFNVNSGLQGANLRLGAANQMAQLGQNQVNSAVALNDKLYDYGSKSQALNQANLDTAYQDFQNQFNYPIQQLQLRNSFLNPGAVGSTTTTTAPGPGLLQQGAGAAMTAAALYSMLK